MLAKLTALFTVPRRRAIYGLVAAGSVALVAFGVITQDQIDQAVLTAGQVIAALAAVMALVNTGGAE